MNKGLAILIIVATLGLGYYLMKNPKKLKHKFNPLHKKQIQQ